MAAPLSVGFVLIPDFTMLALAGFLDTLRLAADEGDRSRAIDCRWTLMSEDGAPVRASNGVQVTPDHGLTDPSGFDYVVVAGGTLHRGIRAGDRLEAWLQRAARQVPLIGICTGSFVLARAGLMKDRLTCVSWFHRAEFELEFPELSLCSDRLFVIDRDRITCAGGTSVVQLASYLVDLHLGVGRSHKGLRVMIENDHPGDTASQPLPDIPCIERITDDRLRRAVLIIERHIMNPLPVETIAAEVGMSARQLRRRLNDEVNLGPVALRRAIRLARATALLRTGSAGVTEIALRAGFADAAHLARELKQSTGYSPRQYRSAHQI